MECKASCAAGLHGGLCVRVKGCDRLQGMQAVGMTTQVLLPPYGGASLTMEVTH